MASPLKGYHGYVVLSFDEVKIQNNLVFEDSKEFHATFRHDFNYILLEIAR